MRVEKRGIFGGGEREREREWGETSPIFSFLEVLWPYFSLLPLVALVKLESLNSEIYGPRELYT